MAATKFRTATEREGVLARVEEMNLQGYTQTQISKRVGVNQSMVSKMLAEIRERYKATLLDSHEQYVREKLEQYRHLRAKAWEAYDRSCEDRERQVEEFGKAHREDEGKEAPEDQPAQKQKPRTSKGCKVGSVEDSLERFKLIITREGRLPASEYLNIVAKTLEAERNLLGLDRQPKKGDVNVNVGVAAVDWAQVLIQVTAAQAEGTAARPDEQVNLLPPAPTAQPPEVVVPHVTDSQPIPNALHELPADPPPKPSLEEITARLNGLGNGGGKKGDP